MDKSEILKGMPRERKIDFLEKLKSGRYKLIEPYEPQPKLNFDLQDDGLYMAKENGRKLTLEEVRSLPGYMFIIEQVSDKTQVNGETPPNGLCLIPFGKQDYLNGLLICNDDNPAHSPEDFSEALKELSISELKQLHASLVKKGKKNNIKQVMDKRINSMKGSIDIEKWIKGEGCYTDIDEFIEKNLNK